MSDLLPCPFCGGESELFVREFTDTEANTGNACVDCSKCGIGMGYKLTEAEAIAAWNQRSPTNPVDAVGAADDVDWPSLDERQRQYLEAILTGGDQARPNLYRLFDAGRQVRSVADKMYWAVRDDEPDVFKAAMAEYEQVVGLNFAVPGVQLRPFDAALRAQPVEHDALAGDALIENAVQAALDAGVAENGKHGVAAARVAARHVLAALSRQPVEADGGQCPYDGRACYVAAGTDDAHYRCGTSACPRTAQAGSEDADYLKEQS